MATPKTAFPITIAKFSRSKLVPAAASAAGPGRFFPLSRPLLAALAVLPILGALTGCTSEPLPEGRSALESPDAESPAPDPCDGSGMERAFPCRTGEIRQGVLVHADGETESIEYEWIDGKAVFESDMVLPFAGEEEGAAGPGSQGGASGKGAALGKTGAGASTGRLLAGRRWGSNVIPYVIDGTLPNTARVTQAIAHWEARTTYLFVPRTSEADYIEFIPSTGCASPVGMQGGRQYIYLASGCDAGSTIHEIGHALGLWHEQSRSDRDRYVNVYLANVETGKTHNFNKYTKDRYDGYDYVAYDFNSIMHYGSTYFSKNGRPTLKKKDGSLIYANRSSLSASDIAGAAFMAGTVRDYRMGDFNGDDRADLLYVKPTDNTVWIALSTGTAFAAAKRWVAAGAFGRLAGGGQYHVADVDGDGKSDLVFVDPYAKTVQVKKSRGTVFAATARFVAPAQFNLLSGGGQYQFADVSGDGKEDLLFMDPADSTVQVKLSTGTAFGTGQTWVAAGTFGALRGGGQYLLGDVDDDRDEDLLYINPSDSTVQVRKSTGSAFSAAAAWVAAGAFGSLRRGGQYRVADVNGDSAADLLYFHRADSTVKARISSGTGYGSASTWIGAGQFGSLENGGQYLVGDVNADGEEDLVHVKPAAATVEVRTSTGSGYGSASTWISGTAFVFTGTGGQFH